MLIVNGVWEILASTRGIVFPFDKKNIHKSTTKTVRLKIVYDVSAFSLWHRFLL